MKRRAYKISSQALIDLEQIWLYTFKNWSIEQADRYYNLLINEMEYVSQNQESGKSMNHIKNGYRASKVKSHLIFYKTSSESEIEIIRILHERMDIENRLKE
ncbi:MAG: type II toxin-antitoxin system RelE/ParE family toxin [Cytophagales bacterium]|jgi:toxin ParE1/3/4|nr:type II toxin-antitoxin system RelE/ParE family toxin [Cytophagales bacterium]MCA6367907.1 type II toxin-antitoxin system RelE/ParE family toxin [Cytophagales bacterium]MCA6370077.1 type II toxin-antitoxin system RelE/ParE family toxin [Cytophagales bacterium]MCA6374479.1 type II toxin-antitoxin system RelE/ParE family toxin [Cytophagales bacterium]MCA6383366.1 type II toxin-antitoxin system RelE/ParE family toxin [Cytophagales bacterium]